MKEILGYQVDEVAAASRMASLGVRPHCLEFGLVVQEIVSELYSVPVYIYNSLYSMLSWKFKPAWSENCSKNRKIGAKVDSRIYGIWRLRVSSC